MSSAKHSVHVLVVGALVIGACSAHQKRIRTARNNGNEPLAACFETCKPEDDACVSTCEREHPTGWEHRLGVAPLKASMAATLHPIAVQDARGSGNEVLAACYESCAPSSMGCLGTCEKKHSTPADAERRRAMLDMVAKIGVEAYKRDREQKRAWAASNGPSNDPTRPSATSDDSSPDPSSGGASVGGSSAERTSGGSSPKPPANIHFGKSCNLCDSNLKLGLACTMPAKAVCGDGELSSGSGFCVARATDKSGSCSARCTSSANCPNGYTCSDPGTGASVCMR